MVVVVVDERPVLAEDETYNLDNKTLHNGLVHNEIVDAVAVAELILDLKVFRQCSKHSQKMTLMIREEKQREKRELTLISSNCNEICCEY